MAQSDSGVASEGNLKNDLLAVVSSWLDQEDAIPEKLRGEMASLEKFSGTDMGHDPDLRTRVRGIAHLLKHAVKTLNGLTAALEEEIQSFSAVTSKCGVLMLPDEVLTMILELVVEFVPRKGYKPSYKWKAAVVLSHVNRNFRAVMLSCPQFWTQLNTSSDMVTTCLPRANGLPLSVYLNVIQNPQTKKCSIDPIFSKLLPLSERWENMHLEFERTDNGEDDFIQMPRHTINAPLLDELIIDYHDTEGGRPRRPRWNWALWNTPNLRVLKAIHHFPLSLPGLSNVVSLIIRFQANEDFFPEILEKISGMECLQYFTLKISNVRRPDGRLLAPNKRIRFPHLRCLNIETELHFVTEDDSPAQKRSVFSMLSFPGLTDLKVEMDGPVYTRARLNELAWALESKPILIRDFFFNKEIVRIFRHKDQFPGVENLTLDIFSPDGKHPDPNVRTEFCIPLNMLPGLKHLKLLSNTRFELKEPDEPDETILAAEIIVASRVVGDALPVLETVTLDLLDPSDVAKWLGEYLRGLKNSGKWDEFEELVIIEDTPSEGGDCQETVYSGDEALDWCETVLERYEDQAL